MSWKDRLRHIRYRITRMPAGLRRALYRVRPFLRRLTGTSGRPDFIIAGAQKAGTTSLARWLATRPEIRMVSSPGRIPPSGDGEFHFFDDPSCMALGLDWYRSFFPRSGVRGEKSPEYIVLPSTLDRIRDAFPDIRLVILLRDPVARAWSGFRHYTRARPCSDCWDWLVPGGTFEENLDREEADGFRSGFVQRGFYAEQLENVFARFPRENVFVRIYERLLASPASVLEPLADFLGIERPWNPVFPRENADGRPSSLPPHLAERLRRIFAGPNERLAALLGHDLPEWTQGE